MYRIDAERFILQITPFVHEEDFSCQNNTNLMIRLSSYDFSADSTMDIGVCDLGEFAFRLNRLYETLRGTAKLAVPYDEQCYIEFTAGMGGHIRINGCINNENANGYTQKLYFENEIDQSYLKDFSKLLFADYGKYVK